MRLQKGGNTPFAFSFPFRREETTGQFIIAPVVGNTFTTYAFPTAGLIRTGAFGFICRYLAFPWHIPPQKTAIKLLFYHISPP